MSSNTPTNGVPIVPPTEVEASDQQSFNEFVRRVAASVGQGRYVPGAPIPPSDPPSFWTKKVLGFSTRNWLGWAIKGAVVVATTVLVYVNTVDAKLTELNTAVKEKPSKADVTKTVINALTHHTLFESHPVEGERIGENDERLDALEGEQRLIRESQIRQEGIDTSQNASLLRIERSLKRME